MLKLALLLCPLGMAVAQPTEKPVVLYRGLGTWQHPIATGNPEAQKFFDQGLALLYGFNRYEALRSFRKASELDPQAVMAYWGMAMAQGPYINMDGDPSFDLKGACAAIDAGKKVGQAPDREKAYLQAAASWCPVYKPESYIAAMKDLAARFPDDLDALTIYAESLMIRTRWHWYAGGIPAEGVAEAERVLQEVLRRWPDHTGANHYFIHAVESSPTPERGIASSLKLMGEVPSLGHLVHMPGHIWLVLGDWETAVDVNHRAVAADRAYFAEANVTMGTYTPYYLHNLDFIRFAESMRGRKAEAFRAAEEIAAGFAPMAQMMPEMGESITSTLLFTHLRFADWDYVLKQPQPDPQWKTATAFWHFARGVALAGRGGAAAAAGERQAFETAKAAVPMDAPWGQSKIGDILALAAETLAARTASSAADAVVHWRKAVAVQDALVYDEPPDWYYPVRESLGAALLRAGQAADAEQVFREGVRRSPRNGRMLFGLMESLKVQNKMDEVSQVQKEVEACWAGADFQLRLEEL